MSLALIALIALSAILGPTILAWEAWQAVKVWRRIRWQDVPENRVYSVKTTEIINRET